jgi:hypothetical protein
MMLTMSESYEWTPLTEAEIDEMTGLAPVRARAAAGDPIAALLLKRILAAQEAMAPEIERLRAEWESVLFSDGTVSVGLASLLGPEPAQ